MDFELMWKTLKENAEKERSRYERMGSGADGHVAGWQDVLRMMESI